MKNTVFPYAFHMLLRGGQHIDFVCKNSKRGVLSLSQIDGALFVSRCLYLFGNGGIL